MLERISSRLWAPSLWRGATAGVRGLRRSIGGLRRSIDGWKPSLGEVCGSDLWPYRGIEPVEGPARDGSRVRRHRRGGRQRCQPGLGVVDLADELIKTSMSSRGAAYGWSRSDEDDPSSVGTGSGEGARDVSALRPHAHRSLKRLHRPGYVLAFDRACWRENGPEARRLHVPSRRKA
jgi:hypothetical protein